MSLTIPKPPLSARLDALTVKELAALLSEVRDGRPGDYARDPATATKAAMVHTMADEIEAKGLEHLAEAALQAKHEAPQAQAIRKPKLEAVAAPVDFESAGHAIAALIAGTRGNVNPEQVEEIARNVVREELASQAPARVEHVFKVGDMPEVKISGYIRPELDVVLKAILCRANIMFTGPAGSGKTYLAEQAAKVAGMPFASLSCNAGMSDSNLKGWLLPDHSGAYGYVPTDFIDLYEKGGVFLLDEIDRADPGIIVFLNSALANGGFNLPLRRGNSRLVRHPDFVCIAAGNTYGQGASLQYSSAERMDESTLDRFRANTFFIDYDAGLEESLIHPGLLEWARNVRKQLNAQKSKRVLSTRFLIDSTDAMVKTGRTLQEAKEMLVQSWTLDERTKVGA